jgi:hypothetical protein
MCYRAAGPMRPLAALPQSASRPTHMVLAGSNSLQGYQQASKTTADALPMGEHHALDGQPHDVARRPRPVADRILRRLNSHRPGSCQHTMQLSVMRLTFQRPFTTAAGIMQ